MINCALAEYEPVSVYESTINKPYGLVIRMATFLVTLKFTRIRLSIM